MIYVEITAVQGSAPRGVGTVMAVSATDSLGTIGGGALEYAAIAQARRLLEKGQIRAQHTIPLGPRLGQCCGGVVTLRYDRKQRALGLTQATPPLPVLRATTKPKLWIWGAGHVGRAIVAQAIATQAFEIKWIDAAPARFPSVPCKEVIQVPAHDMPRLAAYAPTDAHHLILTYSHDIDLALSAALLKRGFAFCGLIGSDTKWRRFRKRLSAMALEPDAITCPIGDKHLGKHPDLIAYGTVKALLAHSQLEASA